MFELAECTKLLKAENQELQKQLAITKQQLELGATLNNDLQKEIENLLVINKGVGNDREMYKKEVKRLQKENVELKKLIACLELVEVDLVNLKHIQEENEKLCLEVYECHTQMSQMVDMSVVTELNNQIDTLEEKLNNSMNFHCPHFLSNGGGGISCHHDKESEIYKLKEENEKLRKVLVFYANEDNWSASDSIFSGSIFIEEDCEWVKTGKNLDWSCKKGGKLARQTLKELEK